jgi:hypothetical protein
MVELASRASPWRVGHAQGIPTIAAMKVLANGAEISSLEDWHRLAPPKGGDRQWRDGRSAKELARLWCGPNGPGVPSQVSALLAGHRHLYGTVVEAVYPERRVWFDHLPGEPRNSDLVAIASRDGRRIAISVEAKADEPFSTLVAELLQRAAKSIAEEKWTNATQRVQLLARALLAPAPISARAPLAGELRYQLLTAAAGAVAFAKEVEADTALLVVHEFVGEQTRQDRLARNEADLNRFVLRLTGGRVTGIHAGDVVGPVRVPGNKSIPANIDLLVAKIQTAVATKSVQYSPQS